MSHKNIADYRRLPYRRRVDKVVEEGQAAFVAFVEEIPWIRVHDDDRIAALKMLDEIFDDAIKAMLEAGDDIPEPLGTLELFGAPEQDAGVTVRLPTIEAGARIQPMEGVTFSEEQEIRPWEDATVTGESRLVPA